MEPSLFTALMNNRLEMEPQFYFILPVHFLKPPFN